MWEIVSWRDRDWARFTDEERSRFFGSPAAPSCGRQVSLRPIVWSVLGIAVLAVVVLSYVGRMPGAIPSNDLPGGEAAPANARVVYSGQTGDDGRLACTTQSANFELRVWVCTEWTILHAG